MSDVSQMNESWINHKAFTPFQPTNEYEFELIRSIEGQINAHKLTLLVKLDRDNYLLWRS